jgi:hypothetical protein
MPGTGEPSIVAARPADQPLRPASSGGASWTPVVAWAQQLAERIALDQPTRHVAVFVHDPAVDALRLVGQVWGAGEDTSEVVVGEWVAPLVGSVCGRVYRNAAAVLCADVSLDADYRSFPGGRTRSSLTVPICATGGGALGVINVEAPWISAFSIADHDRLTVVAADAAAELVRLLEV